MLMSLSLERNISLESSPIEEISSPFFNINKSVEAYTNLVSMYGIKAGSKIAADIFANDFASQSWEATKSSQAYRYFYAVDRRFHEPKLIHSSDATLSKDILEGTSDQIRRGLEYSQMALTRKAMLSAQPGESIVWMSPKKDRLESEDECFYTEAFLNVAYKIDDNTLSVEQYQTDKLDTEGCAALINHLTGMTVVELQNRYSKERVDDVMLAIGRRNGKIREEEVNSLLEGLTSERRGTEDDFWSSGDYQAQMTRESGRKFVYAIQKGIRGRRLKELHSNLLADVLGDEFFMLYGGDISTSCGFLELGGGFGYGFTGRESGKKKNWCKSCGVENHCTAVCYKCGGSLTEKPGYSWN